jgi:hypothetical protein
MTGSNRRRAATGVALALTGVLLTTACASRSPGEAGSISVPGGKDKLKAARKSGTSKPKAGSTRASQKTPRPR